MHFMNNEKIEISKEWIRQLIELVDNVASADDDNLERHGWISHLLGYIHSLDEFLK